MRIRKEAESAAEQYAAQQKNSLAQLQAERDQATQREKAAVEKLKAERNAAEARAQEAVSTLRSQQEAAAKAIDAPREYQTELFERAKQQNTIAVLDTGSGKTMIAILLIQWMLDQEVERQAKGHARRVAFFLTDSVALVYQQSSVLKVNLRDGNTIVTETCGSMNTDLWNKDVWIKQVSKFDVIVCTAEVLNQALQKGFVRIEQINLLVFDEAHHAKANHPYAILVRDHYVNAAAEIRPKIFGMTASPIWNPRW